jgi:hypothetical protein
MSRPTNEEVSGRIAEIAKYLCEIGGDEWPVGDDATEAQRAVWRFYTIHAEEVYATAHGAKALGDTQ